MMRLPALACLAALSAATVPPAAAQYIDQGYREAHAVFGNVGSDIDQVTQAMEKLLPTLEGRWIAVDILAGGAPAPDSPPVDYERFCEGVVLDLTVTSRLGFQMERRNLQNPDGATVTSHFDFGGFSSFLRSLRTGDYLSYIGIPEDGPVPPQVLSGALSQAIVTLYHPNRDTLVLVNLGGRTEYFGRCP